MSIPNDTIEKKLCISMETWNFKNIKKKEIEWNLHCKIDIRRKIHMFLVKMEQ